MRTDFRAFATFTRAFAFAVAARRGFAARLGSPTSAVFTHTTGGRPLITVDHEISVDGVEATQRCVALLFVGTELHATGTYTDRLIYERGGWYFTSRELDWDVVPSKDALPV